MGGVAGHMDHLYENRELTFGEMKEILEAASNGELTAEEKVDGQNLFLSYSIPEGKAKGARNKGNLKDGGLDAVGLARKFAGRGGLEKAFTGGFATFEKAVEALSDEEKERIFGPNTNIWYNAEVMDPGNANVILYDDKTLKIHDVGHFVFDRETGDQKPIPPGTLDTLDDAMERMENQLHDGDFNLARKALVNIRKIEDDGQALKQVISRIDKQMRADGLNDQSTILDYTFKRLINGMESDLPPNLKEEIVKYLLKLPGNIGLRSLKKGLTPDDLQDLMGIISNKKTLLQQAVEPLENAIHDFTVNLLKGLESVFIQDNEKEVMRLKDELAVAVREITAVGSENPEAMAIMQRHLNKIKDFSTITTPVEAVVFDYNGHTYKFAGNFAPLNQILGMFRYGNLKRNTKESLNRKAQVITEKDGKRIALFPGKFKPPHRGHFDYVNKIAKRSDVDEVVIMISPVDYPEVSNAQSLRIWEEYLENGEPNITAKIADYRSPVQAVYEFVADPGSAREGDTVLLVKSSKDIGDTRFDRAQSYAERHNPGVNVEDIVEDPVQSKDGIVYSARDMRKAIADGDKETFLSYAPPSIDGESLWNSLVSPSMRLNSLIDDSIDEISTMAGGAVSGYAGGFGPPNTYDPYKKRSKTSRPKVRRAKRQRRR
jgi:phosphopantetheine adenylyltransferase